MVKDASNNWALNSATGGLDSFKAYQSTNSGDTYIDASNSTGHIRLNYESGSGAETDIYSGSSTNLDAAFLGPKHQVSRAGGSDGGLCLQIDTSGYLTNTGAACGTGSGGGGAARSTREQRTDCVLHSERHNDRRHERGSADIGRNRRDQRQRRNGEPAARSCIGRKQRPDDDGPSYGTKYYCQKCFQYGASRRCALYKRWKHTG